MGCLTINVWTGFYGTFECIHHDIEQVCAPFFLMVFLTPKTPKNSVNISLFAVPLMNIQ